MDTANDNHDTDADTGGIPVEIITPAPRCLVCGCVDSDAIFFVAGGLQLVIDDLCWGAAQRDHDRRSARLAHPSTVRGGLS